MSKRVQSRIWTPLLTCMLAGLLHGSSVRAVSGTTVDRATGLRVYHDEPFAGFDALWSPIHLTVENRGDAHRLDIRAMISSSWYPDQDLTTTSHLQWDVTPGTHQVELLQLRVGAYEERRLSFQVDGHANLALESSWTNDVAGGFGVITISQGSRSVRMAPPAEDEEEGVAVHLEPNLASRYWQAYVGLPAVLVLEPGVVDQLDTDQRIAIARWVRFGGGTVWLRGPHARDDASVLGIIPRDGTLACNARTSCRFRALTGTLLFSETLTPVSVSPSRVARWVFGAATKDGLYANRQLPFVEDLEHTEEVDLAPLALPLHQPPLGTFAVLSVVLALLIGPVNYLILRRKGKLGLFFLSTPLLSLAGMILLATCSIASQGLGMKTKEEALLLHDFARGDGALYRAQGFYSGTSRSAPLVLSTDTWAVPFQVSALDSGNTHYVTTWTGGQVLEAGWVPARQPRVLLTIQPVRVRMKVTVQQDPGGWISVRNGLPFVLEEVVVRLPAGEADARRSGEVAWDYFVAENVPPGERRAVVRVKERSLDPDLLENPFLDLAQVGWTVVARCRGLPHLADGTLGGKVVSGVYRYVGVSHGYQREVASRAVNQGDDHVGP